MEKNNEEENNPLNNKQTNSIPDIYLDFFLNSITENSIWNLHSKLKLYESKGYVTHDKYLQSMKEIFDASIKEQIQKKYDEEHYELNDNTNMSIDMKNIEETINEIYELYFLRFREIKCIIKNNKSVFYLTDFKPENYISSYNVICSITIFLKSCFENKIKLLFKVTDIDEDGFLNESEIKNMITTCNFLFCEEGNHINTNSSILAQSLTNYKVNEILKEILYDPGRLYPILEEEKYITFNILYKSIKLVKDYKYRIIPFYINLKKCLNNVKKEKIIQINDKYKYDFIKISSSLVGNKTIGSYRNLKNQKSFSAPYLSSLIIPKYISVNNGRISKLELPNISRSFFSKKNNSKTSKRTLFSNYNNNNLNQKNSKINISLYNKSFEHPVNKTKRYFERTKSLKDLIRDSTIIEMNDLNNKFNETNKNFNKINYFNSGNNRIKYFFEANYDKIKNIEVEPGLIKFINNDHNNFMNNTNLSTFYANNASNIVKQSKEYRKKSSDKNVSFNFNKDKAGDNYIVQEEHSSEDQENKSKTNIDDGKKTKKIKLINLSNNVNEKNKNLSVNIKNIDNNFKLNNILKNQINHANLRKKINCVNNNSVNQRHLMNSTMHDEKRYKTLDEVFLEIKNQEIKYNSDSYGGFGASLIKGLNSIKEQQKNIKKLLGDSGKKDLSMAFHKAFLNKCKRLKKQKTKSRSIN